MPTGIVTRDRTLHGIGHRITRYRPRIESAYDLIERWQRTDDDADVRWRVLTGAGICTWYDGTPKAGSSTPLTRAGSPSGCRASRTTTAATSSGIAIGPRTRSESTPEGARTPASRTAARYLARVGYGNRTPYDRAASDAPEVPEPGDDDLLVHLVVDHGDHDLEAPGLDPDAD